MTHRRFLGLVALGVGGAAAPATAAEEAAAPTDKWAEEVAALEARLAAGHPSPGGTVFAGSSSIRLWSLDRYFPNLKALNAGFGGSTLAACTRHAPRLVHAWKPRTVVLYAGDNDLANGLSVDEVVRDFFDFAATLQAAVPGCRLVYLSIKASPSRWALWPKAQQVNARIRAICEAVGPERLQFVDVSTPLLGADGQPEAGLFKDDRLHLNDDGYSRWVQVLKPVLAPPP